jgi:hypothetical protein
MTRPRLTRLAAFLAIIALISACGNGDQVGSTTTFAITTTTTTQPATTSTAVATTTTTQPPTTTPETTTTTTTTGSEGLPGEPIDFGPAAGDVLAVIGVSHDDVLNLRSAPGADQEILAGIPPLHRELIALGHTRELPRSFWIEVEFSSRNGWVNMAFVGYLGDTFDATSAVVDQLGNLPSEPTMLELGEIVARTFASAEPPSQLVVTVAPADGDPGEVTIDVIGLGDDAVRGLRAHVFGSPEDGGYILDTVEVTSLCGRGVTDDGACI